MAWRRPRPGEVVANAPRTLQDTLSRTCRSRPMASADVSKYPRDLVGYGRNPPDPRWPGGARVAVQFVVNYEEGGERNILHGDATSEAFLSDVLGAQPWPGQRHMNVESMYEYGSRAGFWRLWRLFTERNLPVTVFGVATALARSPTRSRRCARRAGRSRATASNGSTTRTCRRHEERAASRRGDPHPHRRRPASVRSAGTPAAPRSTRLKAVLDDGGFLYSSDSYADDLPYWVNGPKGPHLIIPYTLDANDMRFINAQGFATGDEFFAYLKDAFDVLYAEGERAPKMMSVGLHCRLVGPPGTRGRARALSRLHRRARARMGRAPARHRAALASRASGAGRRRPDGRLKRGRHDDRLARTAQRRRRGRLRRRARRYLRARAVGGAGRVCAGGRSPRSPPCTRR